MTDSTALGNDPSEIIRDVTPADVDVIVTAVRAMLDVKVAHWQLDEPARSTVERARAEDAAAELLRLSVAGVVLFGDLGDVIVQTRSGLAVAAILQRLKARP